MSLAATDAAADPLPLPLLNGDNNDDVPVLVYLNGWPGTGKLTIARLLAPMLGMRLVLDNHKVIDLAVSIAPRSSGAAFGDVRARILEATVRGALETAQGGGASGVNPRGFIMTGAHAGGQYDTGTFALVKRCVDEENAARRRRIQEDAGGRGGRVVVVGVVLTVDAEENERRLVTGAGRESKLRDVATLREFRRRGELLRGMPNELELDVSGLAAEAAAEAIAAHVRATVVTLRASSLSSSSTSSAVGARE
ncbi:hypothetical protein DFJ73DRAFT_565333 [Zopfochytrium polystomum]|nr:hypothetical protein DFJ73DRAFT_565333 [Zopfochytrium polystomum]